MAYKQPLSWAGTLARWARLKFSSPKAALRMIGRVVGLVSALFLTSCMLCPPGVYLWKGADRPYGVLPGHIVVYTIAYSNTTDAPVTMTIVDDYDETRGSPQTIGGSPHFAPGVAHGGTITWGPAVLPPGAVGTVSYEFTLVGVLSFEPGTSYVHNVARADELVAEATVEVVRPAPPVPGGSGRLVVLADDWPLGEYFSRPGSDAERFILNILNWLTEPMSGGTNTILLDAGYLDHGDISELVNALRKHGYTGDVIRSDQWTPELLSNFAVAILERGPEGYAAALTDYLRTGHGVLVIGGIDASPQQNQFLRQFNIEMQDHHFVFEDTLTTFTPHPITAGVDTLYVMNPTPITVLGPGPVVLCQQYDDPYLLPGEPQTLIWLVALDLASP